MPFLLPKTTCVVSAASTLETAQICRLLPLPPGFAQREERMESPFRRRTTSTWKHPGHHSSLCHWTVCPSSGSTTWKKWQDLGICLQSVAMTASSFTREIAATTWKLDRQFITCRPSEVHFQGRVLALGGCPPCYPTPTGGNRPHGSAAGGSGTGSGQPCDQPARRGMDRGGIMARG